MSEFTKKKYILPLLFSITNSAVTMDSDGAQNCDFRAVVTAVEVRGECDRARRSFGDSGDAGVRFRPRVGPCGSVSAIWFLLSLEAPFASSHAPRTITQSWVRVGCMN